MNRFNIDKLKSEYEKYLDNVFSFLITGIIKNKNAYFIKNYLVFSYHEYSHLMINVGLYCYINNQIMGNEKETCEFLKDKFIKFLNLKITTLRLIDGEQYNKIYESKYPHIIYK